MAQRLVTSSLNTVTPGAYPEVTVKSTPVGIGAGGAIVIIGEAASGAAYDEVDVKENFFSPDQADRVAQEYTSGNIVDAMNALTAPANDTNIQGSVSRVYVIKTNKSTAASATIADAYAEMNAKTSGVDGNKISYNITESQLEAGPQLTGTAVPAFGAALDGAEFAIRSNGGAETTITLGVGGHADITALAAEIDAQMPAGLSCAADPSVADALLIISDVFGNAHEQGWGKSFEISGDAADLTALGLSEGQTNSSAEPEVEVNIVRQDTNVNETLVIGSDIALEMGYEGTSGEVTISGGTMTTTVTGGFGANLSIDMSSFLTLGELADYIDSQLGYTASVPSTVAQRPSASLDEVTSVGIASTLSDAKPGRIKKAASDFKEIMDTSAVIAIESTKTEGLPNETAGKVFLAGGLKGSTTGADYVAALAKAEAIKINFIVPLFSRDATDDILDGETDTASTYTIDAIHAASKDHTLKMSTIKLKRNRIAILAFDGEFTEAKDKAGTLASFRIPMTFQKASRLASNGETKEFGAWMPAVVAAGMQSAGFYRAIVKKYANVISFKDPSGFDSGSPGDVETALEAGLLFLEQDNAGNKWVSDQTTYGIDTNFVYNSLQAVYLSDRLAIDLADSLETAFVGKSLADIDIGTATAFVNAKMETYKQIKMIAASDDAPLGFKNLKIKISGPVMEVSVEVKLATAIYFIPVNIEISQVELNSAA